MAGDDNVLRSFLFGLDWKNNTSQQKEVVGAIEQATLKANLLADSIKDMAARIGAGVQAVSEDFLKLSVLADQTKTSATTILALQQGFLQFAGSAGDANALVQTISNSLRSMNDGNISYYQKFGINQDKVTKQITIDLAEGQRNLAGLSDAAVTQYANLANIPVTTAELIQHHGAEMQRAIDDQKERMKAFGLTQKDVDDAAEFTRQYFNVAAGITTAWQKFAVDLEKPLTPRLAELDAWLVANGPNISSALGDVGKAFTDDVATPLSNIDPEIGKLDTDAKRINAFKDAVVDGLGGVKEFLDTVKAVFELVNNVSEASQKWAHGWGLAGKVGQALGIRPDWWNIGRDGPEAGTIDPNFTVVPFGKKLTPGQDPGAAERQRLNEQPNPTAPLPRQGPEAAVLPDEPPSWWKPWTWKSTPKAADMPTLDASPDALEVGAKNGGFAIPGSGQEVGGDGVALSVGGSPVQSGNPLPVKIDKIEPGAGGVGGGFGGGSGGNGAGDGGGGHGGAPDSIRRRSRTGGHPHGDGAPGSEVQPPGPAGTYRPVYKTTPRDLSDAVVNTIAGEARTNNTQGVDAVIDNMMNRLGTHTYGPSGNLEEVARAPGQYTGYRQATAKEAELIRERIRAIASGGVPDITKGSNEYRADWYHGPWGWKHRDGVNVGGNVFAYNPRGGTGPYRAYPSPHDQPPVAAQPLPRLAHAREAYSPAPIVHRPYSPTHLESPLSYQYDHSDNSVTHHHNYNTSVAVNGVSDPHEAAAAVGSTMDQVFSRAQTKTRMLQGAIA